MTTVESGDACTATESPDSNFPREFRRLSDRWRRDDRNARVRARIDALLAEMEETT